MPTLADLQNRIINEINRDDMQDELLLAFNGAFSDAVDQYADERFWFNAQRVTGTLQSGLEYTDLPSGYRSIDSLWAIIGGVRYRLDKRSTDDIEGKYTVPQVGQPTDWAPYLTQARLWPTPNIDYASIWWVIADVTPVIDWSDPDTTTSNIWTNEAAPLMVASVKRRLWRNVIRNDGAAQAAEGAEIEAYTVLKARSNRRLATGRVRAKW